VALPPLQAPDAAQEVASIEDQERVDAAPLLTVLGFALSETVGSGIVTVTLADCEALPPLPLQVRVKVESALSAPLDAEPFRGSLPDHEPEAAHDVAWVDDQLSVVLFPLTMVLGAALKVTVGAGEVPWATDTVAD
jgi:hypothetical protein